MPGTNITVSQIRVFIGGSELTAAQYGQMQEVVVDQSTSLPDMFTISFRDRQGELIDDNTFRLGRTVEIEAGEHGESLSTIFEGEITAIEPRFRAGMLLDMVVRGYDKTHRMYRQVKSRTFENTSDDMIAKKIAGEQGLTPQTDDTKGVYDHVYQHNQTDMAFLMERAWRIGFECFASEGKLYFRKPPADASESATLTYGEDLTSFEPVMTAAEQVDEVLVHGWDFKSKQTIVGKAIAGQLYTTTDQGDGKTQAEPFGEGKKVIVNQPVFSQAEADALAQARLNEISGAFIQATGTAFRRADIRAGTTIKLEGLGERFSGKYFVSSAKHIYFEGGYETDFEVRGLRSGLLGEQLNHQEPMERWPGAVVAIVTDNVDPENLGRVKVLYPWMSDEHNSWWARVISPGASPGAGLFMLPEINDEVMVVFEQGDFNRPYVLGGVWNGKHKIPKPGLDSGSNDKAKVRTWFSHTGHQITVHDNPEKKIEVLTAGGHTFILDDKNKKIELVSTGGHKLLLDDQGKSVELTSKGTLKIMSDLPMTIESSKTLDIKSQMTMTLQSKVIDIKADTALTVKGTPVQIN